MDDRKLPAGDPAQPHQRKDEEPGAHPEVQLAVARKLVLENEDQRENDQRSGQNTQFEPRIEPCLCPGRQRLDIGHQHGFFRHLIGHRKFYRMLDARRIGRVHHQNHVEGRERIEPRAQRNCKKPRMADDGAARTLDGRANPLEIVSEEFEFQIALLQPDPVEPVFEFSRLILAAPEVVIAARHDGEHHHIVGCGFDHIRIGAGHDDVAPDNGRRRQRDHQLGVAVLPASPVERHVHFDGGDTLFGKGGAHVPERYKAIGDRPHFQQLIPIEKAECDPVEGRFGDRRTRIVGPQDDAARIHDARPHVPRRNGGPLHEIGCQRRRRGSIDRIAHMRIEEISQPRDALGKAGKIRIVLPDHLGAGQIAGKVHARNGVERYRRIASRPNHVESGKDVADLLVPHIDAQIGRRAIGQFKPVGAGKQRLANLRRGPGFEGSGGLCPGSVCRQRENQRCREHLQNA